MFHHYTVFRIDDLFPHGLASGELYELSGPSRVGKTQMCLQLAAKVAGGGGATVAYIDTTSAFDAARIVSILHAGACKPALSVELTLGAISCFRAPNSFALLGVLESIERSLALQSDDYFQKLGLLIVDCPTSVIATVLGGKTRQGHAILTHIVRLLKSIATRSAVAVVLTSHTVADRQQAGYAGGVKTALGETWTFAADHRLFLSESTDRAGAHPSFRALLVKSSSFEAGVTAGYRITGAGIVAAPIE
jgi:RecA/RadA recombinase